MLGNSNSVLIIMGVAGSGKTLVGKELAKSINREFYDADDYHSNENKQKMSHSIALTVDDRNPWLETLRQNISTWLGDGKNVVLACSALKGKYRDKLRLSENVVFVYLKCSKELIIKRLKKRKGHFFDHNLIESQFETLEEPSDALQINAANSVVDIIAEIKDKLNTTQD